MIANRSAHFKWWFHSNTWQLLGQSGRRRFRVILLINFLICLWFSLRNDIMADETGYYSYCVRWAQGNQERVVPTDDSKSPMVLPALIPIVSKPLLQSQNDPHGFRLLRAGKIFMYVYLAFAAFFTMLFMVKMVGVKYWMLPLALLLFDPLVIGHAMVVGTDGACMALLVAMAYTAMRFQQSARWHYWVWCCLFTGLACITKSSMVFATIVPLLAIFTGLIKAIRKSDKTIALQQLLYLGCLCLTIWLVINAAYFFQGSFAPIGNWPTKSTTFQQVSNLLQPIHSWPSPLPYHYVASFDELSYHAAYGGGPKDENTYVGISVLQHFQTHGSVWYYYLVAFVVKWPLLIWLLLFASVLYAAKKTTLQKLYKWIWLWLPPLFFLVVMSFKNPFQIGIRHALLLYPFLYIFLAIAIKQWQIHKRNLLNTLLGLHFISIIVFWPNLIAYSNELIWPKSKVYQYINDSSIYYMHNQLFAEEFIGKHPEYTLPDSLPKPGKYAVPMEWIASDWDTWKLAWLKDNFEPEGLYLHTILLYHVTQEDLQKAKREGRIKIP